MQKDFEKEYYEAEHFWEEASLSDENNVMRIRDTVRMIPTSVKSIADIGCGNGLFIKQVHQDCLYIKTMGFDRSTVALRYVEGDKKEGSIENIDFLDGEYECVSCLEVIEHLPVGVYDQALSELARISNKYLILSVPYKEDLVMDTNQCPNCKSIFNANLHLRCYDTAKFTALFDKYEYKCVEHKLMGKSINYKYHNEYRKAFYPKQFRKWVAPICPICGYQEEAKSSKEGNGVESVSNMKPAQSLLRKVLVLLTAIPKALWPKEERFYWIVGVFEKK
jgi:ubiquinone/menaquinone biosynthesis C-methylase UbiE